MITFVCPKCNGALELPCAYPGDSSDLPPDVAHTIAGERLRCCGKVWVVEVHQHATEPYNANRPAYLKAVDPIDTVSVGLVPQPRS